MTTPFVGEIQIFGFPYAPKSWANCTGGLMAIRQNTALFSLIGTQYGGNGTTTFALPDFRGRGPVHQGSGFTVGQAGGQEFHTVTMSEMPAHTHILSASALAIAATAANTLPSAAKVLAPAIASLQGGGTQNVNIYGSGAPNTALAPTSTTTVGGSQPHENRQPFTVLNFIIALQGIFPSQN